MNKPKIIHSDKAFGEIFKPGQTLTIKNLKSLEQRIAIVDCFNGCEYVMKEGSNWGQSGFYKDADENYVFCLNGEPWWLVEVDKEYEVSFQVTVSVKTKSPGTIAESDIVQILNCDLNNDGLQIDPCGETEDGQEFYITE